MKKLLLILLICLLPILFSCATNFQKIRNDLVALANEDKANVEALKQISEILKETWPFYSGCLDAISDRLSGRVINQKNELDELYEYDKWDDKAAGKTLILRALLVIELPIREIERTLPGFLKLLSSLL